MASGSKQASRQGVARVHTQQSKRKTRDASESKTVFKSVLENPFHIKWPEISMQVQNAVLARVVDLLDGVADYHLHRKRKNKSDKRIALAGVEGTVMEADSVRASKANLQDEDAGPSTLPNATVKPAPKILEGITVGVNEVTKRLEAQYAPRSEIISNSSQHDQAANPSTSSGFSRSPVRVVLVCRADINNNLLINHILHLAAICNSRFNETGQYVKIVPLAKGAELALAQALGLRRACVVSLDDNIVHDPMLEPFLDQITPVVAPWLIGALRIPPPRQAVKNVADNLSGKEVGSDLEGRRRQKHKKQIELIPTHIKQLKTTMPKDIRGAKVERAKGRAEARNRRKERSKEMKAKEEKDAKDATEQRSENLKRTEDPQIISSQKLVIR